jgi:hypothetical protein
MFDVSPDEIELGSLLLQFLRLSTRDRSVAIGKRATRPAWTSRTSTPIRASSAFGLDLASKLDLAASVKVFSRMEGGKKHLYLFGKYWLPAETIEKSSNTKYEGWAREKYLERSSGAIESDVLRKPS